MSGTSDQKLESLTALEEQLAGARDRLKRATAALAPKHKGGEREEYRASYAAVLALERAVAAAKGEEYADPLKFPVQWCTGAPLPHLIASDYKAFLIFLVHQQDPNWDGSYVTIKNPGAGTVEPLALVEFSRCASAKLGIPNDEVFSAHPLNGHGLEPYRAQVVRNSRWLAELEKINSAHRRHRPDRWRTLNHYVFWFHDSTFECVAEAYNVEVYHETFADVLARTCRCLVS